jgi:hypothetical protein
MRVVRREEEGSRGVVNGTVYERNSCERYDRVWADSGCQRADVVNSGSRDLHNCLSRSDLGP